jgi:hypothetical protein
MKMDCQSCGTHFKEDYKKTIGTKCTFWEQKGFPKDFSEEFKRHIWGWFFSLKANEIAFGEKVIVRVFFDAIPFNQDDFGTHVADWLKLPEKKRKQFQRDFYKFKNQLPNALINDTYAKMMILMFVTQSKMWKEKIKIK